MPLLERNILKVPLANIMERIAENLNRLKLSKILEMLPIIAEESQANEDSPLVFLDRLLVEEVTAKEERRVKTSLKIADYSRLILAKNRNGLKE